MKTRRSAQLKQKVNFFSSIQNSEDFAMFDTYDAYDIIRIFNPF